MDIGIAPAAHEAVVTTHNEPTRFARMQPAIETVMILIGLGALAFMPRRITSDGTIRWDTLRQLLEHGTLSNQRYSIVGPLFSTPLYLLGKVVETPMWWIERYNYILFALGLLTFYLLLRNRLDRGVLRAFLLVLIVASMFPNHLVNYYGEVFTALCVGAGLLAVILRPRLAGWAAIVLGVVNTPVTIVALGCAVLMRALQTKRARFVMVVLVAGVLFATENFLRRGSPLDLGYGNDHGLRTPLPYSGLPGFSYPFFFGLMSILFSFGKGLVYFVPGLFLPIRSRLLASRDDIKHELFQVYVLWIAFIVGLVLVYAPWWAWDGGWFWGPRFFLFASIPASFVLAYRLRRTNGSLFGNLMTLGVLVLSVWVGIDGTVFGLHTLGEYCQATPALLGPYCNYTLEYSALWRPFVVGEAINWQGIAWIVFAAGVGLYLAIPLVATIIAQAGAHIPEAVKAYLRPSLWRW